MADYFTKTVLTHCFKLDDDLVAALEVTGADVFPEGGPPETVLDGIVHERPPLTTYSVVWEEGIQEPDSYGSVDEYLVDIRGWDAEDIDGLSDRARHLMELDEPGLLLEILKLNPDAVAVELQEAHTCSRTRLDGYSGRSLTVTRKGYLYVFTKNIEIDDDGTVKLRNEFTPWDEEAEHVQAA